MIYYMCVEPCSDTLGIFAAYYAKTSADRIRLVPYEYINRIPGFRPGTFILTDFDRVPQRSRDALAQFCKGVRRRSPMSVVLNHPKTSLLRFDLLKRLHQNKRNRFDVHRVNEWANVNSFPVFLRWESEHRNPLTGLLYDRQTLEKAVDKAIATHGNENDMMIVEFVDTRDEKGFYKKYSAFRVGDVIYSAHRFISDYWCVKFGGAEQDWDEHFRYFAENPHRDLLRPIFEDAGIQYGRIDYGMVGGTVQTFEINTNPTVIYEPPGVGRDVTRYVKAHEDALARLPSPFGPRFANPLFKSSEPIDFESVHVQVFRAGTFILTDFDRLLPPSRGAVAILYDAVRTQSPSSAVLNHPQRSLLRFDLLRRLHQVGFNRFNTYRTTDRLNVTRFPVFLRWEAEHRNPLTDLIHDAAGLERAIARNVAWFGKESDMMIVEFVDTRGPDDVYRKYSAYRVGDTIYAQHVFYGTAWCVKFSTTQLSAENWAEHDRYVADNPHRDVLRRIFDAADIQYGRIDYGIADGLVQTFEINTNPSVIYEPPGVGLDMSRYAACHEEALMRLPRGDGGVVVNPLFRPKLGPEIDPDALHDRLLRVVRSDCEKKWPHIQGGGPAV